MLLLLPFLILIILYFLSFFFFFSLFKPDIHIQEAWTNHKEILLRWIIKDLFLSLGFSDPLASYSIWAFFGFYLLLLWALLGWPQKGFLRFLKLFGYDLESRQLGLKQFILDYMFFSHRSSKCWTINLKKKEEASIGLVWF